MIMMMHEGGLFWLGGYLDFFLLVSGGIASIGVKNIHKHTNDKVDTFWIDCRLNYRRHVGGCLCALGRMLGSRARVGMWWHQVSQIWRIDN